MNESFISVQEITVFYSFVNEMIFFAMHSCAIYLIFLFLFFILFLILLISSCSWLYFFNIFLFLLEFLHFKRTWRHQLLGYYSPALRISVQQSRKQALRAYCPNIYTVKAGILVSGNAEDYIAAFHGGEFCTFFSNNLINV